MPTSAPQDCPLCFPDGETILWQDASCRVIRVDDPDYPGYCRLIWHDHGALFPGPSVELGRALKSLVVPLLALPQLTHYLLDAWIWRTRDPRNAALQALTAPG